MPNLNQAQTIQIEYQSMLQIADRFGNSAISYDDMYRQMVRTFSLLEQGGWIGKGANQFFHEMNNEIFPAVMRLIQSLHDAQQVTIEVVQIFQQAEQEAKSIFEGDGTQNSDVTEDDINYFDIIRNSKDVSLELLMRVINKFKGAKTRNMFKNIGRALNDLFDTRGNVKSMNQMYDFIFGVGKKQGKLSEILDSKAFKSATFAFDTILGVLNDVQSKRYTNDSGNIDWTKTVSVNTLDTGINLAIGSTGAGAVALLVNAGVQLGGTAEIGLIDFYNGAFASDSYREILQDDANMARKALKNADLGEVTKSVAEFGYNYYKMPLASMKNAWDFGYEILKNPSMETFNNGIQDMQRKQQDLSKEYLGSMGNILLKSANFVDGVADLKYSMENLRNNTTYSTVNSIVQILPIDNSVKSTVNSFVEQQIKQNNQTTHRITETFNFSDGNWRTWFKTPW